MEKEDRMRKAREICGAGKEARDVESEGETSLNSYPIS